MTQIRFRFDLKNLNKMTQKSRTKKLNVTTKVKTPDASKAIKDLDFKLTISPEEGMRRTVDWFQKLYGNQSLDAKAEMNKK